jgi:hypothetical protein
LDGVWLGGRRRYHGHHHHRTALGKGRVQYRRLYVTPVRSEGGAPRRSDRQSDIGTGPLGLIGNLIWLLLAGWWLALAHIATAVVLAVTIIGIPFAWAHVKLAGIALWPIGKVIVQA